MTEFFSSRWNLTVQSLKLGSSGVCPLYFPNKLVMESWDRINPVYPVLPHALWKPEPCLFCEKTEQNKLSDMLCFHMTTIYALTDTLDSVILRSSNEDALVSRNQTPRFWLQLCGPLHEGCLPSPGKPTVYVHCVDLFSKGLKWLLPTCPGICSSSLTTLLSYKCVTVFCHVW